MNPVPAERDAQVRPPLTGTGALRVVMVESPTWPEALRPQQ